MHSPNVSEKRCSDHFHMWLKANGTYSSITWDFEPNGPKTAPDYLLTLNGKQFAVEVTAVMHQEVVDDQRLAQAGVSSAQCALVKQAEQECIDRGVLSGLYRVHFTGAIPNLSKSKAKRRIIDELVKYVAATQTDYQAPEQPIILDGTQVQVCTIAKISNRETVQADVFYMTSSLDWAHDVPFCDLLREAIERKAKLLENISLPVILLLDGRDRIEQPPAWYACLKDYPPISEFHTIFVVRDPHYDFAVRVGEADWPVLHGNSEIPSRSGATPTG